MDKRERQRRRAARGDVRAEAGLIAGRIAAGEFVTSPLCWSCSTRKTVACGWKLGDEREQCNLIAAPGRLYCHDHHEKTFGLPDGCATCEGTRGVPFEHVAWIMSLVGYKPARLSLQPDMLKDTRRCGHDPGGADAPDFPEEDVENCGRYCLDTWTAVLGSTRFADEPVVAAAVAAAKPALEIHLRSTSYCGGKDGTDRWCRCHRCRPMRILRAAERILESIREVASGRFLIDDDVHSELNHHRLSQPPAEPWDDAYSELNHPHLGQPPTEPQWVAALARVALPEGSTRAQNLAWCLDECAQTIGFSAMREAVRDGVVTWAASLPTSVRGQRLGSTPASA